ncbi:TadA family conjugal transfer-associated ATPase [Luedemannella flava]|uniref:TadA family conjugal transfer-associated ATPase n=1 Tax=Luedemannella flava TaxID=349316 RepID=A0ABP4Z6B2_9ACTN
MSARPRPDLVDRVRRRLTVTETGVTRSAVLGAVLTEPGQAPLGSATLRRVSDGVFAEMAGAGPLADLLAEPTVTDVVVNGPAEVWVDRGAGMVRTDVTFPDAAELRRLAQRLAAACGRRLDDAAPFVDAHLPDGSRLHAVLPPVAVRGPYLSLRTFRQRAFGLAELVSTGCVAPAAADLLRAIVAARLAYVVSGGTGTGKTTVLSTLLGLVPPHERIVVVEDAAELRPPHPHVVALQARDANVEAAGGVALRDLVRQALRMRPDRLVVGECRGAEVVDMLAALNTGHEGGAATLHANTAADVPARLEALGLLGGVPREALHAQIAAGLQVVVQLGRVDGRRVVSEIGVLAAGLPVRVVPAWRRADGPGPAAAALAHLLRARGGWDGPTTGIAAGPGGGPA